MANTRIVVKNLPKQTTEEKIREAFGAKGTITDVHLKYNKMGKFRGFAFVGYATDEDAKAALTFFNDTFMGTSKIKVEMCTNLGDPSKPMPWSKHVKDNTANQKIRDPANPSGKQLRGRNENQDNKSVSKKSRAFPEIPDGKSRTLPKKSGVSELLDKFKDDPQFSEFLQVHRRGDEKILWGNDANLAELSDDEPDEDSTKQKDAAPTSVNKKSDVEYLKSKVVSTGSDDDEDATTGEPAEESRRADRDSNTRGINERKLKERTKFTLKLKGRLWGCTKETIRQFFQPLKPVQVRRNPSVKGVMFVKFSSDAEVKQALARNRGFLDGHRVQVCKVREAATKPMPEKGGDKWAKMTEELEKSTETIAESGSLFVRNLAYTVTQEELEKLFGQYGPLSSVRIPVDRITRKIVGFAFVDYLIPEHATKAYAELDGRAFQGRCLHILPGKANPVRDDVEDEGSSFKTKKATQQKASSSSSHNWNTLFLGANAVADVMAQKYNTTKQDLLNPESDSLAVRMALGETQIVVETRNFLLASGVQLDAFSQPATERSKTVFLVKNLPAGTSDSELMDVFSPHGEVSRIVFPPSGITAVVEFQHPTEARRAFRSLAYTKFKDVPLYLEWAPVSVFTSTPQEAVKDVEPRKEMPAVDGDQGDVSKEDNEQKGDKIGGDDGENEDDDDADEPPEDGATLFVKNLNFDTTDEHLAEHFRQCGTVVSATVSRKRDLQNPDRMLSLGYGFVQYQARADAQKALKQLQRSTLDGHAVELKVSDRTIKSSKDGVGRRKKSTSTKQKSSKILVRNVPFEATSKEVAKLFRTFGELRGVRMPRKMVGTGNHRGFAFVDFVTRSDAKRAFDALCHSTHLYGRRLVLEWANEDDGDVSALRRKTAKDFHEGAPAPKKLRKAAIMEQLDSMKNDDEDR